MKSGLKWLQLHWIKFSPILIFALFMVFLFTAQTVLYHQNIGYCKIIPCSYTDINKHILASPEPVLDKNQNLVWRQVRLDKDGKIVPCEKPDAAPAPAAAAASPSPAPAPSCYPSDILARRVMSERFGRQMIWMLFISFNVFLGLMAMVLYVLVALKYVDLKYILIGGLICAAFGVLGSLGDSPLIEPVVKATIEQAVVATPPSAETANFIEGNVEWIVKFVNGLAYTMAMATPFAMVAVLFGVKRKDRDKKLKGNAKSNAEAETPKSLLKQVADLRVILYASVVLLIIGVLRMSSVLSWSVSFLPKSEGEAAAVLFANFTFVIGASYTVLVAAIYLPAYFYLKSRAIELVESDNNDDRGDEKVLAGFNSEFFQFSIGTSLPHIIAIAAPFLTGATTELFVALLPK